MATKKVTSKSKTTKTIKKVVAKKVAPSSQTLMEKFKTHEKDSGSTEFQIATLSMRIEFLVKHLKKHPKDHDSRRGLLLLVGRRRRLLNYLKKTSDQNYVKIIGELGLKK